MSEKNLTYIIQNTCGFDSLVHIFANETIEPFNVALKTESMNRIQKCFHLLDNNVEEGPTNRIYKKRALLKRIEFFIQNGATPDIIIIDFLCNINNLCE